VTSVLPGATHVTTNVLHDVAACRPAWELVTSAQVARRWSVVPTDAPAGAKALRDLGERAEAAFRAVQKRVFADDPDVNGKLVVEVTEAAWVDRVATVVLITPWTLNGLLVPPDGEGPMELLVAGDLRRAFRGDVAPLGVYWAVNLVPDVSRLSGPRQARTLANSFAGPFRQGVRAWVSARR
jgi:hypothetical protein